MAIHVGPGFAAESHRHYAPQLLLGLDSPIALRAREPEPWRSYTAAWIPSRAWHQTDSQPLPMALIYLHPLSPVARCVHVLTGHPAVTNEGISDRNQQ